MPRAWLDQPSAAAAALQSRKKGALVIFTNREQRTRGRDAPPLRDPSGCTCGEGDLLRALFASYPNVLSWPARLRHSEEHTPFVTVHLTLPLKGFAEALPRTVESYLDGPWRAAQEPRHLHGREALKIVQE